MHLEHSLPAPRLSAPALPRLSRRAGFWAVTFSFLVLSALSTAPSGLYAAISLRSSASASSSNT